MIRTRHRLLACMAVVVALGVTAEASASTLLQLAYSNAKTFGNVHIAGGAIDLTSGAMIVTTSSFGFVPEGYNNGSGIVKFNNEFGTIGQAEFGDAAIHDAIIEGANIDTGGFFNGTNGIISSDAATWGNADKCIYYIDNNFAGFSTFRGISLSAGQSIIAETWFGDGDLNGVVNSDDLGLWAGYLTSGQTLYGGPVESVDGDFDYSGVVNSDDLGNWAGTLTLGDGGSPVTGGGPWYGPIVPSSASATAVPEPATLSLLGLAAIAGIFYRLNKKERG